MLCCQEAIKNTCFKRYPIFYCRVYRFYELDTVLSIKFYNFAPQIVRLCFSFACFSPIVRMNHKAFIVDVEECIATNRLAEAVAMLVRFLRDRDLSLYQVALTQQARLNELIEARTMQSIEVHDAENERARVRGALNYIVAKVAELPPSDSKGQEFKQDIYKRIVFIESELTHLQQLLEKLKEQRKLVEENAVAEERYDEQIAEFEAWIAEYQEELKALKK